MDANGNDNTPYWGYCQASGCRNAALDFYLPDNEPPNDPDGFYCEDHANSAGWCWGCGGFWGGVESFDFSKTGLCENCEPGYLRDIGESDEDDWDEDEAEWDDMPNAWTR